MAHNTKTFEDFTHDVKYMEKQVEEAKAELMHDFTYNLAWKGEELWKLNYKLNYLKYLSDFEESTTIDYFMYNVDLAKKQLTEFCLKSYNVREQSSGALHREVSTWKFQAHLELLEYLKTF